MIANMNILLDKAAFEKSQQGKVQKASFGDDVYEDSVVKTIISKSLASGRIGSLTVDPMYLEFYNLDCKC